MELMDYIKRGDIECVKELLKYTDLNIQDDFCRTLLITASRQGHVKIVRMLLDAGAHIDIRS